MNQLNNPDVSQPANLQSSASKRKIKKIFLLALGAFFGVILLLAALGFAARQSDGNAAKTTADEFVATIKSDTSSDFDMAVIAYTDFAFQKICDAQDEGTTPSAFNICDTDTSFNQDITSAMNDGTILAAKNSLQYDLLNKSLQTTQAQHYDTVTGTNDEQDKLAKIYYSVETNEGTKYIQVSVLKTDIEDTQWKVFDAKVYDDKPIE